MRAYRYSLKSSGAEAPELVVKSYRYAELAAAQGQEIHKGYRVTDAELRELYNAMDRHDGLFYLAAAAGFVADHKAQGDRLDFGQIFKAFRLQP
jgi:hypothetical protein